MPMARFRPFCLGITLMTLTVATAAAATAKSDYLPPWNPPPSGSVHFSTPPVDAIADLHGDVVDPQLTVFFAGNQFMVVHKLIAAFRQAHPKYQ